MGGNGLVSWCGGWKTEGKEERGEGRGNGGGLFSRGDLGLRPCLVKSSRFGSANVFRSRTNVRLVNGTGVWQDRVRFLSKP